MTGGVFKRNGDFAYARAAEEMSTKSETDFEWSVKIYDYCCFAIGIASKLKRANEWIEDYDQNAILLSFDSDSQCILEGSIEDQKSHANIKHNPMSGDVIRFRFEPQRKKLVIDLVRVEKFINSFYNKAIKIAFEKKYEVDLKDNVNYFPVIQSFTFVEVARLIP